MAEITRAAQRDAQRTLDAIGRGIPILAILLDARDAPLMAGIHDDVRSALGEPWADRHGMACPPDALHVELDFANEDDAVEAALWAAAQGGAVAPRACLAAWLRQEIVDQAGLLAVGSAALAWADCDSWGGARPLYATGSVVEFVSTNNCRVWQRGQRVIVWRNCDSADEYPVAHRVMAIPAYLRARIVVCEPNPAVYCDESDWEEARLHRDRYPWAMR